jgi:hypothetical protein
MTFAYRCMVVDDLRQSQHRRFALQIDIIAYIYTMVSSNHQIMAALDIPQFQCELLGLAKAMTRGEDMVSDPVRLAFLVSP